MGFNKEEFKERARLRGIQERVARNAPNPANSKLTERTTKPTAAPAKAPVAKTPEALREERIATIKAKLAERKAAAQAKVAPKAKVVEAAPATTSSIQKQALSLKERIAKVRQVLKEDGEFGAAGGGQPILPPGTDPAPIDGVTGLPGAAGASTLPPEILAEIQNIAVAAQNLAVAAGVSTENPAGSDVQSDIPPEVGAQGASAIASPDAGLPGAPPAVSSLPEKKSWRDRLNSSLKEETANLDEARARMLARREALKAIREKALSEGYEGVDTITGTLGTGDKLGQIIDDGAWADQSERGVTTAGRKIGSPSPDFLNAKGGKFTPKAAKTWPTKPGTNPGLKNSGNGRLPEEVIEEDETKPKEKMDESWTTKAENHYIEKRQLSYRDLLTRGFLG